jgi:hypothetical protein
MTFQSSHIALLVVNPNIQFLNPKHIQISQILMHQTHDTFSWGVEVLNIGELKFWICPSTLLRAVSPSSLLRTVSQSNGLSNHFVLALWSSAAQTPATPVFHRTRI